MKPCPNCGATLTPGSSDCSKCGVVFDGDQVILPASEAISDAESQNKAASASSSLAAFIFTLIVLIWPFASFGALFMFDAPGAGGIFVWLLFWSTVLYGPIYIFALLLSRTRKSEGDTKGALKAWLYLCGSDVAIWHISFFLVMVVCSGKFTCR